jgi:integrase
MTSTHKLAGKANSAPLEPEKMPALPPGLVRNPKSGVYYHRRRIPQDLVGYFGKKELIKSLNTSSYKEALERFRVQDSKLLLEWDARRQRVADFCAKRQVEAATIISELTPEIIDSVCQHYLAISLHSDEQRRDDGTYDISDIADYQTGYKDGVAVLKAAVAVGDVATLGPLLKQFLDLYNYRTELTESDYRRLAIAFGRVAIQTNESLLQRLDGQTVATPTIVQEEQHMLSAVIQAYLAQYPKRKAAMFKKLNTVMPLFEEIVGNKSISKLRQTDVIRYFDTIQNLPARWHDICRIKKIRPAELAAMKVGEMSPKTYDHTYKAAITPFLSWATTYWQDHGFPTTLTTKSINYTGERIAGESKQRAFKPKELQRLLSGSEMKAFAEDASLAYKFWLPHVGLFTGARVNELCQLNPMTDIRFDKESATWFLDITEVGVTDVRIGKKSVKTATSKRKVPVHSQLIALGFIDYVKRLQRRSALMLFPEFPPSRGRAAPLAGDWFREFLVELNLRDETHGARISGMHAFRSTFLNRAANQGVVNAEAITGHAGNVSEMRSVQNGQVGQDESIVVRNYRGELDLGRKVEILEKITFAEVTFIKPVKPPPDVITTGSRPLHSTR